MSPRSTVEVEVARAVAAALQEIDKAGLTCLNLIEEAVAYDSPLAEELAVEAARDCWARVVSLADWMEGVL